MRIRNRVHASTRRHRHVNPFIRDQVSQIIAIKPAIVYATRISRESIYAQANADLDKANELALAKARASNEKKEDQS